MGLSSSQARLLTITARLTSNEYESQQISNAKMRLATQSEDASTAYIQALNSKKLVFQTYDAQGTATTASLTAAVMYQYSDTKNQYNIVNASGQVLLSQEDVNKFQQAANLDEYLESYGLTKEWKSTTLQANYETLNSDEYKGYKSDWDELIQACKNYTGYTVTVTDENGENPETQTVDDSSTAWQIDKSEAYKTYMAALETYSDTYIKYISGYYDTDDAGADIDEYTDAMNAMAEAKATYSSYMTYDGWLEAKAMYAIVDESGELTGFGDEITSEYENMQIYNSVLAEFNAEAEDYGSGGTSLDDLFVYNDATKALWYTNLWYRLNGESTDKSSQGEKGQNYSVLESQLLTSSTWLQDALSQGLITIEAVTNKNTSSVYANLANPTVSNLTGISWDSIIYTSCSEIIEQDDDQAVALAEAEYERKTQEIDAKDQKYENRIKTLDTEHQTLQTEYDSVQNALNKNIERSFKAFS